MSSSYMRVYHDKELEGLSMKYLNEAEYGVFCRIRSVAGKSVNREGFLEWGIGIPLSYEEITIKIRSNLPFVTDTINKCVKIGLLEWVDNVLHIVDWETDQLSKTQRAQIHKVMENGKRTVEVVDGKPLHKDYLRGKKQ